MTTKKKETNIIITGANGDIGIAITKKLVNLGYNLFLTDLENDRIRGLLRKNQSSIHFYKADLTKSDDLKELVSNIKLNTAGQVDGLVNNAGIYPITSFDDYDMQLWEQILATNLTSIFALTKLVVPMMKHGGSVINISSTGAHLGSRDPGYSATKAGVIGLTKSFARSLWKYDIRVNAVAPGLIDTRMSRRMKKKDIEKNRESRIIKRRGQPSDVGAAVNFLLSSDSSYITGFTVDVNGGLYLR